MRRTKVQQPVEFDFAAHRGCVVLKNSGGVSRSLRLGLLSGVALCWATLVIFRLYDLQIDNCTRWQVTASRQHNTEIEIASERGPIYDREGRLLAVSVPAGSVYVRPGQVPASMRPRLVAETARILKLAPKFVEDQLARPAPFVWLKRQVPRVYAEQVNDLEIPGLGYLMEARRYYPYNNAGSTLLGTVGVDGSGLAGMEAAFDRKLSGQRLQTKVVRDALGKQVAAVDLSVSDFKLPKGQSLRLTIDGAIQLIMHEELERGFVETKAKAVAAVMVDADTGNVLALGEAPSFNFNRDSLGSAALLRNRVVETVYEPGSTMKPLVVAAALDAGLVRPEEEIDCGKGYLRFGRHMINDVHPYDRLSVHDVVVRSSNVGASRIGMRLGRRGLYTSLKAFGFGQTTDLSLPGQTRGILRPVENWAEVDVATHSFGQGIAVTPLQMVRAFSAIANGGFLPELRLVEGEAPLRLRPLMARSTAERVEKMLQSVVEDPHGTGRRAAIPGVVVGGKTGTAQKAKVDGRGYAGGKYIASFIGFAKFRELGINLTPVMIVLVDEPNTTSIYGGTLAGPVFQRIMERTKRLLTTKRELQPRQNQQPRSFSPAPEIEILPDKGGVQPNLLRVAYQY